MFSVALLCSVALLFTEPVNSSHSSPFPVNENLGTVLKESGLDNNRERAIILSGFPSEPLTIDSAFLCDENIQPVLPNNKECLCDKDPTCRACFHKRIEHNENLRSALAATELQRKLRLRKWFPKGKRGIKSIIVSAVNYGQLYLFLNWACSCIENKVFDPREYMWIVPTDIDTYTVLKKFGFNAEPLDWMTNKLHVSKKYIPFKANVGAHSDINNVILAATSLGLQLGYHVLMMDVDVVFLRNPFPVLEKAVARRDFLGMHAPRVDSLGFINTGFIFFAPTDKTLIFVKSLENLYLLKTHSDQSLFNSVLRHPSFQQLDFRILPRQLFFSLWRSLYKYGFNENTTLAVHAIGVRKMEKFQKYGFWHFVPEKCEFYDREFPGPEKF
mmetsp:Transcript_1650/g.2369  ORF Transcript_1650/g.2369 Transcript_1650/m.2369 type:complete len:386 (+) Transcript_1650:83-1240(+)